MAAHKGPNKGFPKQSEIESRIGPMMDKASSPRIDDWFFSPYDSSTVTEDYWRDDSKHFPSENPFLSEAQRRLFWAKEARGELPKGTAHRWSKETPSIKKLPERKG